MLSFNDIDLTLANRFQNGFKKLANLPSPRLLKDSEKGAKRIAQAIQNSERIVIIGDYDVDGVTSSAIAFLFFQEINYKVEVVIPNRFKDGYGVTPKLLERVSADLIITVDNGIHAFESAEILKNRGIDLIITDHHNPSQTVPNAFAVINPKQKDCKFPLKNICGAEVIWFFLAVVKAKLDEYIDMMRYLDFVAIATISDVMPIIDFNHTIVKKGLELFAKGNRIPNQIMLSNISKGYISADDIAFQIAPRLNSSGRIDNAMVSFNFLISQNYDQTAKYFFQIEDFNEQRKEIERNLSNQVIKNVDNSKKIILYYDTNLHEGIIGIVASRIVEKFQKPTIIFSLQNEILKGSGRSIGNIDIFKLIESTQHLLLKWGGHKMAGGLSLKLENFEEFQKIILNEIEKYKKDDFNEISKSNLGELDFNDINFTLIEILEKYEPYGEGNPRPTFQAFDVLVIDVKIIGKNKEYLKITVKQEFSSNYIDILVFKTNTNIKIKDKISFEYSIDKTIFRGKVSIQGLFKRFIS